MFTNVEVEPKLTPAFAVIIPEEFTVVKFDAAGVDPPITQLFIVPPDKEADVIVGDVKVLFVSVSVVALPTSVSVDAGNVNVPVLTIVLITGAVNVLFVSVSVVVRPTSVSVIIGNVNIPILAILLIVGAVKVLFVNVSVVALPTNVSVVSGSVKTLELVVGTQDKVMLLVPELIITDPVVIKPPVPDVIEEDVPEFDILPEVPNVPSIRIDFDPSTCTINTSLPLTSFIFQ